jgi:hypothetical protein
MSVVYVGYDVEKQPVDLLDDLIEVGWEVVAVLSTGKKRKLAFTCTYCSVADPDPGSGIRCLFDPWIRNRFFQDPGSRISDPGSQTHTFESLVTIFWVKSSIIL